MAIPAQGLTQTRDVVVFAAASLKNALDDVAAQWGKESGKRAAIAYAGSPQLARQIEQGAPADLFVSADLDWMDYLERRGLILKATRTNLLGNRIVLVAPSDSRIESRIEPGFGLAALLGTGRLAIADPNAVPAGKYGKASLQALGVWDAVKNRLAQAENARAALLLVSRGEVPLGVVFSTDAQADPNVRILGTFPESTHPPIVYPAAVVAGKTSPDASVLLAYLSSPSSRPLFEKHGFTVLQPARN